MPIKGTIVTSFELLVTVNWINSDVTGLNVNIVRGRMMDEVPAFCVHLNTLFVFYGVVFVRVVR